jgi:arylsulfatase A-like enzyme
MSILPLHRILLTVAVAGSLLAPSFAQRARSAKPHPNVLLIVLDDVGTDKLDFYGETAPTCPSNPCDPQFNCAPPPSGCVAPYPRTPNLDALRRGGLWFDRAYAMPVCSATRSCMQTGRLGLRTGIGNITSTTSIPGDYSLPNSEVLLAELLRDGFVGGRSQIGLPYASAAFGKWHLTTSQSQDYGHAVANGYERFYGTIGNISSHYRFSKIQHDKGSSVQTVQVDGRFTTPSFEADTWHASVATQDALDWIQDRLTSFFAYVGYSPPHAPVQVPPLSLLSTETQCELACAGLESGDILNALTDPVELLKLVYRAQLEAVDTEIGRLIQGIPTEVRRNTMIFVMGDNGSPGFQVDQPPHDGDHAKSTVYDLGTRVPLIVSGPHVPKPPTTEGWRSSALVSAVDMWLTIAELTGADASQVVPLSQLDSISFLPVIHDPLQPGGRTSVFTHTFLPNGIQPLPSPSCYSLNRRSLSDGEYKYIRLQVSIDASPCGTPTYAEELYHLPSDPEEQAELIGAGLSPEAALRMQLLSAEMDALSGT